LPSQGDFYYFGYLTKISDFSVLKIHKNWRFFQWNAATGSVWSAATCRRFRVSYAACGLPAPFFLTTANTNQKRRQVAALHTEQKNAGWKACGTS
jgi:hypothetical protein